MADRWWGWIHIRGVPAAWVKEDGAETFRYYDLNDAAIPERIRNAINDLRFELVEFDADGHVGDLTLSDDQLAGGSWAIREYSDLPQALMEAGLPFDGGDDGAYEHPGCKWWWRPGMATIADRTAAGDEIVLSLCELRALWSDDPVELHKRLCAHFNVDAVKS